MKNYGEVFREIRQSRNLSQEYVAGEVISVSQVSKFERGNHGISLDKFLYMIEKVGMTLGEFKFKAMGYELDTLEKTMRDIQKMVVEQNRSGIERILSNEKKAKEKGDVFEEMNYLMFKSVASTLDESLQLTDDEKERLVDYLYSIDDWGYHQLLIYGNSMQSLDMRHISRLTKELVLRSSFYDTIYENKRVIIKILLNSLLFAIDRNELSDATYFKKMAQDFMVDETEVYERTIFLFAKGMLDYRNGQIEQGEEKMLNAIDIFEKVGSVSLARNCKKDFEEVVNYRL